MHPTAPIAKRRKGVTLLFQYVHDLSLTHMVRFLTVPFAQLRKNAEENPPIDAYSRVSVNIPLRNFDKNQGEKLRTQRDIDRNQRLLDATQAQVFSDVDSTYETLSSNLILRQPHKIKYWPQAVRVRDSIGFSCQNGCASLLDFLDAESEYRTVQISYVNLIGSYLTAASQLNFAVGREVIP